MSEATDMHALYIAAETAVLKGQSYSIGDRTLTRANLDEIRRGRKEWERKVADEQASADGASSMFSLANFADSAE